MTGGEDTSFACSALLAFARARVDWGQHALAHHIKTQVARSGRASAEHLDYGDDRAFLEPALFAFFEHPEPPATLDQILYGAIDEARRPEVFDAYADRRGGIELSGFGELRCNLRGGRVTVAPASHTITAGAASARAAFCPVRQIGATPVAYSRGLPPLFGRAAGGSGWNSGGDFAAPIVAALALLRDIDLDFHWLLLAVTRRIVTLAGGGGGSSASLAAHGAVFLCPPPEADAVFFLEDLAHQCGHVLFNAATLEPAELLAVDPATPLAEITGDRAERRSIYVALHGVFTECLMAGVLAAALRMRGFDGRQRHELVGRLSYVMRRLYLDLGLIRELAIYTAAGRALVAMFEEVFARVFERERDRIIGCDLTNQAYAFSYDRFVALNA